MPSKRRRPSNLKTSSSESSINASPCVTIDSGNYLIKTPNGGGNNGINYFGNDFSTSANVLNNNLGNNKLTTKEQQQLDRNLFLSGLTKDQLKIECRKRGQKITGTKNELVLKKITKFKKKNGISI